MSTAENAGVELLVTPDAAGAARAAAQLLAATAERGGTVALSGGTTPRPAYELAASLEPDWSDVDLWLVDERCVPPADEHSNLRLVRESLVDRLARPPRLHPVDTAPAPAAAAAYARVLRGTTIDLALLGLGSDGHTASLFPDAPSLDEDEALAVAAPAGLPPWVDRVTMTIPMLAAAREIVFLVVGADKAPAARRAFAEQPSRATPASLVRSIHGRTIVVLDRDAAAELHA